MNLKLPRAKRYSVHSIFLTLQGEGRWAGARAVFVRFTGCNVWSGHDRDRERDTKKGFCAAWCDTEFRRADGENGGVFLLSELVLAIDRVWDMPENGLARKIVVLTGGEPTLQIDDALVEALHRNGFKVHLETNGSRERPADLDWVTLSPKPPMPVVAGKDFFDEVKVVLAPGVNPRDYESMTLGPRWIQPCDYGGNLDDLRSQRSLMEATRFALDVPGWRLCLQTHKLAGIP